MTAETQISLLADIPLDISVELDQRILTLRKYLNLKPAALLGCVDRQERISTF